MALLLHGGKFVLQFVISVILTKCFIEFTSFSYINRSDKPNTIRHADFSIIPECKIVFFPQNRKLFQSFTPGSTKVPLLRMMLFMIALRRLVGPEYLL